MLVWLLIAAGAYLSFASGCTIWRMRTAPWGFTYAISDRRAYIVDGRKPKLFQSVDLTLYQARHRALNIVSFGRGKDRLPGFAGLDPAAAKRAVYWANEGRKLQEFQNEAAP